MSDPDFGWVFARSLPESQLKDFMIAMTNQGMATRRHFGGTPPTPPGQDPDTRWSVDVRPRLSGVAQDGSEDASPTSTTPYEPDPLEGLPERLKGALIGAGITSRERLTSVFSAGMPGIGGLVFEDATTISQWLGNGGPAPHPVDPPPPPPPPATQRVIVTGGGPGGMSSTSDGQVILPGMESLNIPKKDYVRQEEKIDPKYEGATVLDGNPNVKHQGSIILPKTRMNKDRDGLTEPG